MHNATLVAECHVGARENVVRNRLPEHLDSQNVRYYLLRLSLDVWMYEGDMVIATYYISECR